MISHIPDARHRLAILFPDDGPPVRVGEFDTNREALEAMAVKTAKLGVPSVGRVYDAVGRMVVKADF